MTATVLLLGTDEAAYLEHSVPAAKDQRGADVVVVDNGSRDDTGAVAARHEVRHLRLDPRRSFCAANNAAIEATGGDAVLILNADCLLAPGFLAAALPRLAEPGVGSVAPKLIRAVGLGRGQRLDAIDAAGMVVDRRRKNGLVGHGRPSLAYDTPGEAFGADGAAALYRRETLEDCAVEGSVFDDSLERWASDADVAWRARVLGWRCVYEPRAVAHHVRSYSPSTRSSVPERDRRMQFRNRYLMMAKYETRESLLPDLPRVAAYEALALGHAILRERHLLRGYGEAARRLPAARRRRALVQRRRRERGAPPVPSGLEPTP